MTPRAQLQEVQRVVVINPGSRFLRVGFSDDKNPRTIPTCVAIRLRKPKQPAQPQAAPAQAPQQQQQPQPPPSHVELPPYLSAEVDEQLAAMSTSHEAVCEEALAAAQKRRKAAEKARPLRPRPRALCVGDAHAQRKPAKNTSYSALGVGLCADADRCHVGSSVCAGGDDLRREQRSDDVGAAGRQAWKLRGG
jgi:hypothetical protein